jgi:hypothetical protein
MTYFVNFTVLLNAKYDIYILGGTLTRGLILYGPPQSQLFGPFRQSSDNDLGYTNKRAGS